MQTIRNTPRAARTPCCNRARRACIKPVATYSDKYTYETPSPYSTSGRSEVRRLLQTGQTQGPEMSSAISMLIQEAPPISDLDYALEDTMTQGSWKVFWAPHITSMSSALFTRFDPIVYKLRAGGAITSNVKYSHPLFGSGWLSASGSMRKKYDQTVELQFDKFWVDLGDKLRPELDDAVSADAATAEENAAGRVIDALVGTLGRAAFFPQFAIFPVDYLDSDLAVFTFPPLNSKIAVTKQQVLDVGF